MFFFVKRFFYIIFYKAFNFVAPQEGENIILQRVFKKNKGFYIDVGAHHPIRFSNTLNLYHRGWNGINIEPNEETIEVFKKKRPRDINLNIAISTMHNSCVYYKFKDSALNTTDINILKMRERQGYKCIKKINVQTQTLSQVLSKYCKTNSTIDILKIDVEGRELDVLKSNNWKKFIPKVIICEIIDVDVVKMLNNSVYKFLKSKNYLLYCKLLQSVFFFHKNFKKNFFN